jgi:hypothetical protein
VGILYYHGLGGSTLAFDAAVSGLLGVSSPPSPGAAQSRAEKTKFVNYSEGVRRLPIYASVPKGLELVRV